MAIAQPKVITTEQNNRFSLNQHFGSVHLASVRQCVGTKMNRNQRREKYSDCKVFVWNFSSFHRLNDREIH